MPSSPLLEAVYQAVEALPQASVENAAAALESGPAGPALHAHVLNSVVLPHERAFLSHLLECWEHEGSAGTELPPHAVAAALRSAAHTRSALRQQTQVELVWTGPSHGMSFRRTDQALLQVIQASERELLLVTFAAYKVPLIVNALSQALQRGVTVHFVAESAEESAGKVAFDAAAAMGQIANQLRLYVWPKHRRSTDKAGNFGALHAKCALADRHMLFVSSANLTEHALILNMEMGLLVQGGTLPHQVHTHFERLIQQGELVSL